jgi:hypothetical protein
MSNNLNEGWSFRVVEGDKGFNASRIQTRAKGGVTEVRLKAEDSQKAENSSQSLGFTGVLRRWG